MQCDLYLLKKQNILNKRVVLLFGTLEYEITVSSKIPTKLVLDFCPEFFFSFLGASWKLFGIPGVLVNNIVNKEAYRKPKKLPGSPHEATKNFRTEIQK